MPPDATSARPLTIPLDDVPVRIAASISWRRTPTGEVERWRPHKNDWQRSPAWVGTLLEGLEAGHDLARLERDVLAHFAKLPEELVRHRVRRLLHKMHQEGVVDLAFPAPPPLFGTRWRTGAELGRGGVGVVYRCRDIANGAEVAVKLPWGYYAPLARTAASVRTEAAVLGALDHPCIVRLIATFEEHERPHLVREVVEGPRLDAALPLDRDALTAAAHDLAGLVQHAHARGWLLLDLQPSNFILREGRPVLIDAGLAARIPEGGVARFARAVGSRGYAAPEVCAHHEATARSDVWALGRLLFALSSGVQPAQDWGEKEILERLQGGPVDDVIRAFVRDRPEDRPSDPLAALSSRLR